MVKIDSQVENRTGEEHPKARSLTKDDKLLDNYLELEFRGPATRPRRKNILKVVLLLVIFFAALAGLLRFFI